MSVKKENKKENIFISQKTPMKKCRDVSLKRKRSRNIGNKKGFWTEDEDKILQNWIDDVGPRHWVRVARLIPGRNGKQCREHWFNNLNSQIIKGNWTDEEDFLIMHFYKKYNGSWIKMIPIFKSRSENSIKNRFYSELRKIASKAIKTGNREYSCKIKLEVLLTFYDKGLLKAKTNFLKSSQMSEKELEEYVNNIEILMKRKPSEEEFIDLESLKNKKKGINLNNHIIEIKESEDDEIKKEPKTEEKEKEKEKTNKKEKKEKIFQIESTNHENSLNIIINQNENEKENENENNKDNSCKKAKRRKPIGNKNRYKKNSCNYMNKNGQEKKITNNITSNTFINIYNYNNQKSHNNIDNGPKDLKFSSSNKIGSNLNKEPHISSQIRQNDRFALESNSNSIENVMTPNHVLMLLNGEGNNLVNCDNKLTNNNSGPLNSNYILTNYKTRMRSNNFIEDNKMMNSIDSNLIRKKISSKDLLFNSFLQNSGSMGFKKNSGGLPKNLGFIPSFGSFK